MNKLLFSFTMIAPLITCLFLILKAPLVAPSPHPDCISPSLLEGCKKAKCSNAEFEGCEEVVSPYPAGDQCCDQDTLKEIVSQVSNPSYGGVSPRPRFPFNGLNGKDGEDGEDGEDGRHGKNGRKGRNGKNRNNRWNEWNGKGSYYTGIRSKRQAYEFDANPSAKWQSPITVYINFANIGSSEENIKSAIGHIEASTCLQFTFASTLPSTDHISFGLHSEGCASFVGKSAKTASPIIGDEACYSKTGNLIHLLAQTLGLWQQTQRIDSKSYINVFKGNLQAAHVNDFTKINPAYISNMGFDYDYASITHHPAKVFSSNGLPTLIPVNPEYVLTIGQRVELSFLDSKLLNKMYCSNECSSTLECSNGGYQNPEDCTACVCPDGFNGKGCTMGVTQTTIIETNDCGGEFNATSTIASIHSPGYDQGNYPENAECQWLIKGLGGKVELKFEGDFSVYSDENSVCQHWVEIRYNKTLISTGPRFCGELVLSQAITSLGSDVIVVFKSNSVGQTLEPHKGFKLTYKLANIEACSNSTCQNGGECLTINSDYKCRCSENFAGKNCEIDLNISTNQCQYSPCLNNGTCIQKTSNTFLCTCPSGFTGNQCQYARCGGCGGSPGFSSYCMQRKCKVGFNPPRKCTKQISWFRCKWIGCRQIEYTTVDCVADEVCCDYAVMVKNRCAPLGWTKWSHCSKRCGGGEKMRYQYGLKEDRYQIIRQESKECNTELCSVRNCNWYRRYLGYC